MGSPSRMSDGNRSLAVWGVQVRVGKPLGAHRRRRGACTASTRFKLLA